MCYVISLIKKDTAKTLHSRTLAYDTNMLPAGHIVTSLSRTWMNNPTLVAVEQFGEEVVLVDGELMRIW